MNRVILVSLSIIVFACKQINSNPENDFIKIEPIGANSKHIPTIIIALRESHSERDKLIVVDRAKFSVIDKFILNENTRQLTSDGAFGSFRITRAVKLDTIRYVVPQQSSAKYFNDFLNEIGGLEGVEIMELKSQLLSNLKKAGGRPMK